MHAPPIRCTGTTCLWVGTYAAAARETIGSCGSTIATCAGSPRPASTKKSPVPSDVRVARLGGALWHDAVTDVDQFLQKISRYSTLSCGAANRLRSPPHIAAGAVWAFLRSYFLQLGFLEGWRGLVIANCDAQGTFLKHLKRYLDARSRRREAAKAEDRRYSVRG